MVKGYKQYSSVKYTLLSVLMIAAINTFSQADTTKKIKAPKHYFTPTLFSDYYVTPDNTIPEKKIPRRANPNLKDDLKVRNHLKSYQYSQLTGGFYFPLLTKDYERASGNLANFHLLVTGAYLTALPRFGGISDHDLMKASLGLRGIYNSGKKGIWFFDATPFMSTDLSTSCHTAYRLGGAILYDYMANPSLSFRIGFIRTFLFGNRYHLPFMGIRVGRLDRSYLSIQFPQIAMFSFPLGRLMRGSLYAKPMGGLFNMANNDTVYYKNPNEKTIYYGRFDMNYGIRLDGNFSKHFSIYVAGGVTGQRRVGLFSDAENASNQFKLTPFYGERFSSSVFANIGFTIRIGKAKSIYNNYNIYEAFNMNSTMGIGDNNTGPSDNIPNYVKKKAEANLKIKDVQDLIEAQDLY